MSIKLSASSFYIAKKMKYVNGVKLKTAGCVGSFFEREEVSIFIPMKRIEVVAGIIRDGAGSPSEKVFATQRGYGDFRDGWEFPGGKIEAGETPERALARELREELSVEVHVGDFLCTVEYDYPVFHLTMHCYFCTVVGGELTLLEHEAARWLGKAELLSVDWLPADMQVVEAYRSVVECGSALPKL